MISNTARDRAVIDSIEKWKAILAGKGEDRAGQNCALCQYTDDYAGFKEGCAACPFFRTHGWRCDSPGKPWARWYEHQTAAHALPFKAHKDCPECKALAENMLKALEAIPVEVEVQQ